MIGVKVMLLGITLILFSIAMALYGSKQLSLLSVLGLFIAVIGLIGRDRVECTCKPDGCNR